MKSLTEELKRFDADKILLIEKFDPENHYGDLPGQ